MNTNDHDDLHNGVNLKNISQAEFEDAVKEGYSIVDFWAEWCHPCHMIAQPFKDLAAKWDGKVKFFNIDIDSNNEIAQRYGIMSIPHFIIFKDGGEQTNIKGRIVGAQPIENFEKELTRIFESKD